MTIFVLGFIATGCVCGLAWMLCAASARADKQARQQAEDAAYLKWRAMHRADVAPQHTIVLSSRRRDDGAA